MAQSQNDSWLQAQEQIRRGEYVQSIPVLQKILETDSTQVEAALQLGFVQQRLGQLPAARKTYETVLRRDTSQIEALNQLAILSEKNAQYRRALHYYQRLIGRYTQRSGFLIIFRNEGSFNWFRVVTIIDV
ncbi:MAG: tetratricopeptide repeat protein, partial [Candidatus Phytoplasma australasiaticum]|nr:tetratricopeptide repeat protein [Candidatus Phytoplasma australasiaticum]